MKMSSYWRRVDSKSIITTIIEKFRRTYTHTLEDFVKVKAMNGVTPAQFRNMWDDQKLEDKRKHPPLEVTEGVWPDWHLAASRTVEEYIFGCFKPHSWKVIYYPNEFTSDLIFRIVVLVAQSCLTLCDQVSSPPGFSVHGILQARILERVAISFSRGSSKPRDQTQVSCTASRFFSIWATREAQYSFLKNQLFWITLGNVIS